MWYVIAYVKLNVTSEQLNDSGDTARVWKFSDRALAQQVYKSACAYHKYQSVEVVEAISCVEAK